MNIIGCLDIPDSGDYILGGEYVDNCTENELSEIRSKKIGFIFQQFNLLPELTAVSYTHLMPKAAAERTRNAAEKVFALGRRWAMVLKYSKLWRFF